MADFLGALAEFDRAKGWDALGYRSLFWFLHRRLGLSKAAAYHRKVAADLVTRFPEVLPTLRDGRLCLSSVTELAKVLTEENVATILPRFFHCSSREAAELRAEILPAARPPVRELVTRTGGASASVEAFAPPITPLAEAGPPHRNQDTDVMVHAHEPLLRVTSTPPAPQPSPPVRPPEVVPLDGDLRRLHITVSKRLLAKVELARDALSHSHPGASMDTILEAGLDLVIERHRKRRGVGATAAAKPRRAAPERITADVKRRVWERDGGRCQWPVEGGGICGSTLRLEFDHRMPRGMGGSSGAENVRLLCRFHNQRAARDAYGDELMDRFAPGVPRASEPVAEWRCKAAA